MSAPAPTIASPTPAPGASAQRRARRCVIISPCRDEAAFMRRTLESVSRQTVPPALWVVVDDGSTDDTPRILEEYTRRLPWLRVVRRADRGARKVGPGVIDAFYAGLAQVPLDEFDYVCKLDMDLELGERYFETCFEMFEAEATLGNLSGKVYLELAPGKSVEERIGDENAVGAAKLYRVACYKDIGGFAREVCWDGLDGHACRQKGWVASSRRDAALRILHLRQTGSSHRSVWHGRMRWGGGKWFMGSAWWYIVAVAAYRMIERPYVLGGVGIAAGYFRAAMRGAPRAPDLGLREAVRRFEWDSLALGKRGALKKWDDRIRASRAAGAAPSMGGVAR